MIFYYTILTAVINEDLQNLLFNISLIGSPKIKVFTDCPIRLMRLDPE